MATQMATGLCNDVLPHDSLTFGVVTPISLFKSSGRRPPRHIHNSGELMFFIRWSSQRIGTLFNFCREARPCSELVAFRIIWRSVSEIFGVVSDLLYDLRQTGA